MSCEQADCYPGNAIPIDSVLAVEQLLSAGRADCPLLSLRRCLVAYQLLTAGGW